MINFDANVCTDLTQTRGKEWLETNGLGGFASATITGMNTRRYHALLTAARRPPTDRVVLLSKFDEALTLDGVTYDLGTNQYPGAIHPQGFRYLHSFRLDPFPVFTFKLGNYELEKMLFMVRGENTTVVRYCLKAPSDVHATFNVRPLVAFRDYHALARADEHDPPQLDVEPGIVRIAPPDFEPALWIAHDAPRVHAANEWFRNFEYGEEQARGFDFKEDLYNPCAFVFDLRGGDCANFIASTKRRNATDSSALEQHERARRHTRSGAHESDEFIRQLHTAANQFIVSRGRNLATVIAGYHWFTDWGRDTMISLPGLTLTTGRYDVAREIFDAFAEHISQGMIPNRFPDAGETPEYNTVDATLWFFHAVGEYVRRTHDREYVRRNLYDKLKDIIAWHERGTRYGIRADADGLLQAGVPGVQLTWMDAKVGDWVVTPRTGKPVEIQALWYNALCVLKDLATSFDDAETAAHCADLATRARKSFNEKFRFADGGYLYDVIGDDGVPDKALRPNQIFAVSLPHSILDETYAAGVVAAVERDLLTPYGLRSLSPHDPAYRPRYEGDSWSRDGSYHQGTVWGWLIGHFITAYLKVNGRTPEAVESARGMLAPFRTQLADAGLGQISEIFDGDAPHTPRGCIAQAWSIAEVLRCEVEELRLPEARAGHGS